VKRLILAASMVAVLMVAGPGVAGVEASVEPPASSRPCPSGTEEAAQSQYGETCGGVVSIPNVADAADAAAEDAAGGVEGKGGAAAFERAITIAELARKYGITVLPATGGTWFFAPLVGLVLVTGGLVVFRRGMRR
jgi:LPXTG-motif cell wall-anchored protein